MANKTKTERVYAGNPYYGEYSYTQKCVAANKNVMCGMETTEDSLGKKIVRAAVGLTTAFVIAVSPLAEGIVCAGEKTGEKAAPAPVSAETQAPVGKAMFLLDDPFLRRGAAVELFYNVLAQDSSSKSSDSCGGAYNSSYDLSVKEYGVNGRVKASVTDSAALTFDVNAKKNTSDASNTVGSNYSWSGSGDVREVNPSVTLSIPFSFRGVDVMELGAGMSYYSRNTESENKSYSSETGGGMIFVGGSMDGWTVPNITDTYSSNTNTTWDDSLLGWHLPVYWRAGVPLNFVYTQLSGKRYSRTRSEWSERWTGDLYNAQGQYQGPYSETNWGDSDETSAPRDISIKNVSLTMPLQFGKNGRTLLMPGYAYYSETLSADGGWDYTESVRKHIMSIVIKQQLWKHAIVGAGYSYTIRTDESESSCSNSSYTSHSGVFTISTTLQF